MEDQAEVRCRYSLSDLQTVRTSPISDSFRRLVRSRVRVGVDRLLL
jgi:hypothetical protein